MAIKRLLLLSGPMRAGKSSVSQILKDEYGFAAISSSAYLRAYGHHRHVTERFELQELGDRLDLETDFAWVVDDVAVPLMEADPGSGNWFLDAVRKPRQVEHFRSRFPEIVRHVHLYAPEEILSARYAATGKARIFEYELAIAHPNEITARSLSAQADLAIDTTSASAEEVAARIIQTWRD